MATTEAPAQAAGEDWTDQLEAEREALAGQQDLEGGEVAAPAPPVEEILLAGTVQLGLFKAGPKLPTSATVTIRGKTLDLQSGRAYEKGARLEVRGVIVIDEVGQKDKRNKATGGVTDCVQRHSGFWEDLEVVPVEGDG